MNSQDLAPKDGFWKHSFKASDLRMLKSFFAPEESVARCVCMPEENFLEVVI